MADVHLLHTTNILCRDELPLQCSSSSSDFYRCQQRGPKSCNRKRKNKERRKRRISVKKKISWISITYEFRQSKGSPNGKSSKECFGLSVYKPVLVSIMLSITCFLTPSLWGLFYAWQLESPLCHNDFVISAALTLSIADLCIVSKAYRYTDLPVASTDLESNMTKDINRIRAKKNRTCRCPEIRSRRYRDVYYRYHVSPNPISFYILQATHRL